MKGLVVSKRQLNSRHGQNEGDVFDREVFQRNTMQDAILQQEILELFFNQLAAVRARLEQGPVSVEDSKFMAHTLRGAAAAVGAKKIETIAAKWEVKSSTSAKLRLEISRAALGFMELASSKLK